MSSNVGLSTPRGSGTSGYVQRNLSLLKPRSTGAGQPYSLDSAHRAPKQRKPDQAILTHDRLREIEIKVLEFRDSLEEKGELDDDQVDEECEILRARLVGEMDGRKGAQKGKDGKGKGIKGYQVHELAEAKAVESERLRRALGLKGLQAGPGQGGKSDGGGGDGDRGDEHPMARQERMKREREMERAKAEVEREEGRRERGYPHSNVDVDAEVGGERRRNRRERSRSVSSSRSRSSRSPS